MDKNIVNTVFKAVGLAMGVGVLVLSILNKLEVNSAITLLSIGLVCLGIAQFNDKK